MSDGQKKRVLLDRRYRFGRTRHLVVQLLRSRAQVAAGKDLGPGGSGR